MAKRSAFRMAVGKLKGAIGKKKYRLKMKRRQIGEIRKILRMTFEEDLYQRQVNPKWKTMTPAEKKKVLKKLILHRYYGPRK